jgi:hypothetical protein
LLKVRKSQKETILFKILPKYPKYVKHSGSKMGQIKKALYYNKQPLLCVLMSSFPPILDARADIKAEFSEEGTFFEDRFLSLRTFVPTTANSALETFSFSFFLEELKVLKRIAFEIF